MRFYGQPVKGRGTSTNPHNRFESLSYTPDPDYLDHLLDSPDDGDEQPSPRTQVYRDPSRSILSRNDSPDLGFSVSVNPYRGCEHGCIYCYARPTHEFLGMSAGLDFETRILAKEDAPALLRTALSARSYRPEPIIMCGITDPYQPVERRLLITRGCLQVLAEFRNPVAIITKNALVARDRDLLANLAESHAASVFVSITTLNPELARTLEPRASAPQRRLAAINLLAEAGVPVGVMSAPIIPGLNDHEVPAILQAAADAGARAAGHTVVRLPYAVSELFVEWLEEHYPERKNKVLNHIRALRRGKLNDPRWHTRMRGEGRTAQAIHDLFEVGRRKAGLTAPFPALSAAAFRRPERDGQLALFTT